MVGCTQPTKSTGSGVGVDLRGEFRTDTLAVISDTNFTVPLVKTGSSSYLYIGSSHGVSSKALLKFDPDTVSFGRDSLSVIDSARLFLRWDSGFGSGNNFISSVEASLIDVNWKLTDTLAPDLTLNPNTRATARIDSTTADSITGTISFAIDTTWVNAWRKRTFSGHQDTALYVLVTSPNAADRLTRLHSQNSSNSAYRPVLYCFGHRDTTRDTVLFSPEQDAFFAVDTSHYDPTLLAIGGGAGRRSGVTIDMTPLNDSAKVYHIVVNRARLFLYPKHSPEWEWAARLALVWGYSFTSNDWTHNQDSTLSSNNVYPGGINTTDEPTAVDVSIPITRWLGKPETNHGLLLRTAEESLNIIRGALYGTTAADPLKRPFVVVEYTELPK